MLAALLDLVLPATCALCHVPGEPLCPRCYGAVEAAVHARPRLARPLPEPPGMPSCWVTAQADPALRAAVTAYKDEDRRELGPALATWLAPALRAAVSESPELRRAGRGRGVLIVPVTGSPRAKRRRGDVPLVPLVTRAAADLPGRVVVAPVLRATRVTRDQASLNADERAANLGGSMGVAPRFAGAVEGSVCVVVDDLVTTGATLAEAAATLRAGGADEVVAAAIGAVKKRSSARSRLSVSPT